MDPKETLRLLLNAVLNGDDAREHAENLQSWLDRGGFSPVNAQAQKNAIVGLRAQLDEANEALGMLGEAAKDVARDCTCMPLQTYGKLRAALAALRR